MNKNSNEEIIKKLESLEQLLNEAAELNEYIENGCPKEYAEKTKKQIKTVDELKSKPTVFENFPTFPLDEKEMLESKKTYEEKKKILKCVAYPTTVCLVLYFLTHWNFLNTISTLGIMATIILAVAFHQSKKTYAAKKKEYEDSLKVSNDSITSFRNALKVYEQEKEIGINAARNFKDDYKTSYETYTQILEEYAEQKVKCIDEFLAKMEGIKSYDFMPEEYYHLIRPIIVLLKSGRADSYKEALNLAIQEEKEEEAEAARRAEDARRTQILEEQAAEERRRSEEMARHNREMEHQQQMQQKMMLDEQRRQTKAMEAQQRESSRAAMEASKNASMRCARCAKHDACGRARGVPNCGAFEPKRY